MLRAKTVLAMNVMTTCTGGIRGSADGLVTSHLLLSDVAALVSAVDIYSLDHVGPL
jgi:hypothetical protein